MKKIIAVVLFLLPMTVSAQQEPDSPNVYYVADYNIEWESLFQWNQIYRDHSVAILQKLEDEGIITGWSAWMHNTGGEYNWRLVLGSKDWDNFDEFWDRYLNDHPENIAEQTRDMVIDHRDQIWDSEMIKYADDVDESNHIYETLYHIKFSNIEDWFDTMQEKEVPLWDTALEKHLITGYVVLGHNTGDRYNHGRVFLFKEWDTMDDFHGLLMENIFSDENLWNEMGSQIEAHTDVIWDRVPDQTETSN